MFVDFPPQGMLLSFTSQERQLLLQDAPAIPSYVLDRIAAAPRQGEGVRVWLDLEDVAELLQGIATEAERATSRGRQESLLDLYARLLWDFGRTVGLDRMVGDATSLEELSRRLLGLLVEAGFDPESASEELARLIDEQAQRPEPELGGLSRNQLYLLHTCGWWAEPFPIRLEPNLSFEQVAQTQFFRNVRVFLQAVDEWEGAPTTARGNLTRAFVEHMLERLVLKPDYLAMMRRVCKVINESDVWPLHIARVVCEVGKLVRKYKKRFVLTRKGRELLQKDRAGALYHHLFDTMFRRFNLDYLSHWADVPGIQDTIPYELYRIGQLPLGQDHDIEELIPIVFAPAVREEISRTSPMADAAEWLMKDHLLRPLESFGLVKVVAGKHKPPSVDLMNRVRRLPLFDAFIRFEV